MVLRLTLDGQIHEVTIVRRRPHLVLLINGAEHEVSGIPDLGEGQHSLTFDGQQSVFTRASVGDQQILRFEGRTFEIAMVDPFAKNSASGDDLDTLKAPMPGAVVSVQKNAGDTVSRGETIVTIESMKLQTTIPAPRDGVIAEILKGDGATFERGEILVTLHPEDEKA